MDDELPEGFDEKDIHEKLRAHYAALFAALRDEPGELIRQTLADSQSKVAGSARRSRFNFSSPTGHEAVLEAAARLRESLPHEDRASDPELLASLRLKERSELRSLVQEFARYGVDVVVKPESMRVTMPDRSYLEWTLVIDDRGIVGAVTEGRGISGYYHSGFGPLADVVADNWRVLLDIMSVLHHAAEELQWHAGRP